MSGKRSVGKKQISMEFVVGLLFIGALLILGYFTIILSRESWSGDTFYRTVAMPHISGLRPGDKVMLLGVQVGQVEELQLSEDMMSAQIVAKLDRKLTFREDYVAEIRNSSVLGGNFLYLELGDPEKPEIPDDVVLQGRDAVDVFSEVGRVANKIDDALGDVQFFLKGLSSEKSSLYKIMNEDKLYNDAVKAFETLSTSGKKVGDAVDDIKSIVNTVDQTMGEFKAAGKSINEAGQSVTSAANSVKGAADNIKETSATLNAAIADAREGKGTVGKLLTDDKLYNDFQGAAADIRVVVKKAVDAKSSIGRLIADDGAMYNSVKTAFDEFGGTMKNAREVVARVNRGEGTIGKLVNDETVWRDLKQAIKDIQGAIDDFREQAPILTFGSFIFGSL